MNMNTTKLILNGNLQTSVQPWSRGGPHERPLSPKLPDLPHNYNVDKNECRVDVHGAGFKIS